MKYNKTIYYIRELKRYFNDACHNFGLENDASLQLGYLVQYAERGIIPIEWALQEAFRLYNEQLDEDIETAYLEYLNNEIEFIKFTKKGFLLL